MKQRAPKRPPEQKFSSKHLREARKAAGISVQMLADLLSVHRNTVIRWEAGGNIPGPAQLSLKWILREAIEARAETRQTAPAVQA